MAENSVSASYRHPMIQRYVDDVEKVIGAHSTILTSTLQKQIGPDGKTVYLKGSITFIDLSLLEMSVFAVSSRGRVAIDKYRYQFMDKKGRLVFRYDNAPHHRELPTFPHHKHLPDRVSPSSPPSLGDILNEVSAAMLNK